jgi:hypothetical protein
MNNWAEQGLFAYSLSPDSPQLNPIELFGKSLSTNYFPRKLGNARKDCWRHPSNRWSSSAKPLSSHRHTITPNDLVPDASIATMSVGG